MFLSVKHRADASIAHPLFAVAPMTPSGSPPSGQAVEALPPALLAVMMMANRIMTMEAVRGAPDGRLTPPQFRILNYLHTAPGASLSEVAAYLGVRLPTASVMLVKLASEGLVLRTRHPESRRRMKLVLTDQGSEVVNAVRDALFQRLAGGLRRLSTSDIDALEQGLPAMQRLLGLV